MALNLSLAITSNSPVGANMTLNGVATVTNTEAVDVELQSMRIFEQSTMGAVIRGPYFETPNVAPGEGFPTLATSGVGYYPFQLVVAVPNTPGSSPSENMSINPAYPAANSWLRLAGNVYGSDGSSTLVGTAVLQMAVKSAVAPYPVPQGGTFQYGAAGNGVNWFFF